MGSLPIETSAPTLSTSHFHRMEGDNLETQEPLQGSHEWEETWVMCPCSLCKFQKRRRRRISLEHVEKHGEFDRQILLQGHQVNEEVLVSP